MSKVNYYYWEAKLSPRRTNGSWKRKGYTDDCVDRGEKESKETGGMKGCVGPLWWGCRRTGSQRQVSPGRKWRVSPSDKLFLQNKEIIRKMTAGPTDGKPGRREGGSEICHLALAGDALLRHHLLRKVNNGTAVWFSRRSLLSVSHSILFLIFLFLSLISMFLSDTRTLSRTHPPRFLTAPEDDGRPTNLSNILTRKPPCQA